MILFMLTVRTKEPTMIKYRFHMHTWSPADGHRDRKIVARNETMEGALAFVIRTLEAREPGVIVNAKAYEVVK